MSYENNGQNVNYEINEFGEIVRKDYAFRSAKKSPNQPLPTNRSAGMVYFLTCITFGIYGIVLGFNMAGETNITCEEDGKRTPGFWEALLLSIITLGIYMMVWYCKWLNREADYLKKYDRSAIMTGGQYLAITFGMMAIVMVINVIVAMSGIYAVSYINTIIEVVFGIWVLGRILAQHNAVNKLYNLRHFPSKG